MVDSFGRKIDYLRMSLTGRCQQRCTYCARESGGKCVKDSELSAEDFIFTASVFASLGFRKIRLTGGEPLLRRDILQTIKGISETGVYEDTALTTNGLELAKLCLPMKEAGLKRINISLDSTDPEIYKNITGADLTPVLEGLYKAIEVFDNVKINAVLLKDINSNPDGLFKIAENYPVTVRFIELMPMGGKGRGVTADEILARYPELRPLQGGDEHSPERLYTAEGYKGKIGFISPVSRSFCSGCNRMRLTWDGKLRPCLGDELEIDAAEAIIKKDSEALTSLIEKAIEMKPEKNSFGTDFNAVRPMNAIGG